MMKIMMVVIGHGDDQVLELGKEERKKQKAQDKCDIHSSFTKKIPLYMMVYFGHRHAKMRHS